MKIVFFEVSKEEQPFFTQSFKDVEVVFFEEKLNETNIAAAKDADVISVFIGSVINKNVIDSLFSLKFIATRSTGFDHIDCEYAKGRDIKVSNVPAYGSHTVAEFAFGLILNLSRKIIEANSFIKESSDYKFIPEMEGFDLQGKTLGVIGTGRIGKNVIKIARGFGMNVVAYDLHPDMMFAKENSFFYKTLPELLSLADIITLHAPYTKENYHLINKESIAMMKRGVYLINTARGELLDTDALISGLKEGIIAGAGLDVLEGERELKEEIELLASPQKSDRIINYKTLLEDRVLIEMPNVIITPHIAFYSKEAEMEIMKITAENIHGFFSGSVQNIV